MYRRCRSCAWSDQTAQDHFIHWCQAADRRPESDPTKYMLGAQYPSGSPSAHRRPGRRRYRCAAHSGAGSRSGNFIGIAPGWDVSHNGVQQLDPHHANFVGGRRTYVDPEVIRRHNISVFAVLLGKVTVGDRGHTNQGPASCEHADVLTFMGLIPERVACTRSDAVKTEVTRFGDLANGEGMPVQPTRNNTVRAALSHRFQQIPMSIHTPPTQLARERTSGDVLVSCWGVQRDPGRQSGHGAGPLCVGGGWLAQRQE